MDNTIYKSDPELEIISYETLQKNLPESFYNVIIKNKQKTNQYNNPDFYLQKIKQLQDELFFSNPNDYVFENLTIKQQQLVRSYFGDYFFKSSLKYENIQELIKGFLLSEISDIFQVEDFEMIKNYLGITSIYPCVSLEELNKTLFEINCSDNLLKKRVRE